MTARPVVLFPDLRGAAVTHGSFAQRLRADAGIGAQLLAALNGPDAAELTAAAATASRAGVATVTSARPCLEGALRSGYANAAVRWRGRTVVRLDTAEHPTALVGDLAACAERTGGLVVADLTFPGDMLRAESIDEFAQLDAFPALLAAATGGAVRLSGAHGMQAVAGPALPGLLGAAERLCAAAFGPAQPAWAWDTAMVLAAWLTGTPFTVVHTPAIEVRDRPRAKVAAQFAEAAQLAAAAAAAAAAAGTRR